MKENASSWQLQENDSANKTKMKKQRVNPTRMEHFITSNEKKKNYQPQ